MKIRTAVMLIALLIFAAGIRDTRSCGSRRKKNPTTQTPFLQPTARTSLRTTIQPTPTKTSPTTSDETSTTQATSMRTTTTDRSVTTSQSPPVEATTDGIGVSTTDIHKEETMVDQGELFGTSPTTSGESRLNTVIGATSAVILALSVVAILVTARFKHLWCFAERSKGIIHENYVVYSNTNNQSEQATLSRSQSRAENALYEDISTRDHNNEAERVNPDHVVYAEIVSSEPARKPAKMAPKQEPEVIYTEVGFKTN